MTDPKTYRMVKDAIEDVVALTETASVAWANVGWC